MFQVLFQHLQCHFNTSEWRFITFAFYCQLDIFNSFQLFATITVIANATVTSVVQSVEVTESAEVSMNVVKRV